MPSPKTTARLAGFFYLIVVLTGIFSLAYVPSKLIVWTNPAQTLQNITASVGLFRLGIAASALCYIAFLVLPLTLYRLLHPVNKTAAQLMVVFAVVSVPISFINLQQKLSVLSLIDAANATATGATTQIAQQVMLSLEAYNSGIVLVQLFWGLWLLPFGYLVYNSNALPKLLGVLLMLGCFGYLISSFGTIISPAFSQLSFTKFITIPASLGEIGICLWLLVFGIKTSKYDRQ